MTQRMFYTVLIGLTGARAYGAQLDLAVVGPGGALPPNTVRLDVLWTMETTDTPTYDLDGIDARFNVLYPAETSGELIVTGVTTLPGWTTAATTGIGDVFWGGFFLSTADVSGEGISGTRTEFTTVLASVLLEARGNVAGTQVTFRHNNPQDPLPAAYDGPPNWQLRWQEEVNGPFQFDIGVGNPGDSGTFGDFPYQGYETYQPLTIPEPASLALLALGALILTRLRSHAGRAMRRT